jgi:hypothetical protein
VVDVCAPDFQRSSIIDKQYAMHFLPKEIRTLGKFETP